MLNSASHGRALGDITAERNSRIAFLLKPDASVVRQFDETVLTIDDTAVRRALLSAWEYAQRLDYCHPGQSKELYLAHPLRVTTLYMRLISPIDQAGVMTAILHNVMEVTNVKRGNLAPVVGEEVSNAIESLTVDRSRQWNPDYKRTYYADIENGAAFVARVKILDKLDNLFLLCLNPSDQIREQYLQEIEQWLLPMAQRVLPGLAGYLRELVTDNRRIGYRPLQPGRAN